MRWALNKFYYTRQKNSLTTAYMQMLKHKYCDASGNLLTDYPSVHQFRYFYRKHNKRQTEYTADVSLNDGMLSLHIFVDVSIVEVYANRGEKVLTCQAFPKGKEYGVSVDVCGKAIIEQLVSYEIV